jgi:protein SCO1/2
MPRSCRYVLTSWLAVTSILFGAFSPALAEGSAEPSATALIEALVTRREPVGGPFDLIDHTGQRRTDADFRGKLVVIYFGYTHCPDVCPTSLFEISEVLRALGKDADKVNAYFVSVDPERDTQAAMKDYLSSFDPHLKGLTGEPQAVAKVISAYRVYARKVPLKDGDYTMDHTALIYLMDRDGNFVAPFNLKRTPEEAAKDLKRYL